MTHFPVRLLAPIIAVASLLGVAAVSTPSLAAVARPGAATSGDPANIVGFGQLGACLASADRLQALYVMDVSGSLVDTDPSGQRFDALEASLAELGQVVGESDGQLKVEAALSVFGNTFRGPDGIKTWTPVPEQASGIAEQFREAAEGAWEAARPQNQGTNYQAALSGARDALLDRGTGKGTCRVMFWFTDGLFNVGDPVETNRLSRQMCAPGGLLDAVRKSGISVIALALTNAAVVAELAEPESAQRRGELKAMAVGEAPGRTCGTVPMPEGYRSGVYLSVVDSAGLAALFSAALAQSRGGVPVAPVSKQPVIVDVEPGVGAVQVDVTGRRSSGPVSVTAPDGSTTVVQAGSVASPVGGGSVSLEVFGDLTVIQSQFPAAASRGRWTFDVGQATSVNVYLFSGLRLAAVGSAAGVVAGSTVPVEFVATDVSGEPADLTQYREVRVEATVQPRGAAATSAPADVVDPRAGRITAQVTVPDDATSVRVGVEVTPVLASGLVLPPVTATDQVLATLPSSFPTLSPSPALELGLVSGVQQVSAPVTLSGSPDGPTRVCFGSPVEVEAPPRAGQISVSVSASECVDLAASENRTVEVALVPEASADGGGSAVLPVVLTSAPSGGVPSTDAETALELTWAMERPVDQGRRAGLTLLLVALAIAAPLLLLWLTNSLIARFVKGDYQFSQRSVLVGPVGLEVDGPPLDQPTEYQFGRVDQSGARRIKGLGAGLATIAASAPVNPFGGPRFAAEPVPGVLAATLTEPILSTRSRRVTPGLGQEAVLLIPTDSVRAAGADAPIRATLILVTRGGQGSELTELVSRLHAAFDWSGVARSARTIADQSEPRSSAPVPAPAVTVTGSVGVADDPLGSATSSYIARTHPDTQWHTSSDDDFDPLA